MRKLFLLFFIATTTLCLNAQKPFKKNTFYGELGGSGVWLSANYERQLTKKRGLGIHVGLGYASSDEKFRPTIPIGVNYLLSLGGQKSFIDLGVAVTVAERYVWDDSYHTQDVSHPYEAAGIPSLGYRHHTPYGLMWRISYCAIFTGYRIIPWFPSISIGWGL